MRLPGNLPYALKLFIVIDAGFLLVLAFAPFALGFFAPIALIMLAYATLGQGVRRTFILSLVFALGYFGLGVSWVFVSMHTYGNMSILLAGVATFLFVLFNALLAAAAVSSARYVKYKLNLAESGFLISLFPISWVLFEWLRSFILTGFPWLLLGSSQIDTPLSGFLPLMGELGVSFLLLVSCGMLLYFFCCRGCKRRFIAFSFFVFIWALGAGLNQIDWNSKQSDSMDVALVQGNIPISRKWDNDFLLNTLAKYMEHTRAAMPADLIIWPETAITASYSDIKDTYIKDIENFLHKNDTTLISGIVASDTDGFLHNSLLALGGKHRQIYHKRHLVPFGEYVPLINGIVGFIMHEFNIPMSDFRPGKEKQELFELKDKNINPSICYEVAYAGLIRDNAAASNILLTVSNDSWFGSSIARYQHLAIARVRARENAKFLLRATNDGITAVINEQGKIVKSAGQNSETFIKVQVQAFDGTTPFAKFGNGPLFFLITLFALSLFWVRKPA